jgi:hypothetical protein
MLLVYFLLVNNAPALFPIGVTTEIWTATDASNNSGTATQIIIVEEPAGPLVYLVDNDNKIGNISKLYSARLISGETGAENVAELTKISDVPSSIGRRGHIDLDESSGRVYGYFNSSKNWLITI